MEAEVRSRSEAVRLRKKMESDLNEMEVQLGHANRQAADSQRSIRHLQTQVGSPGPIRSGSLIHLNLIHSPVLQLVPLKVCRRKRTKIIYVRLTQVKEQQVELEDEVQLTNQLKEQIILLERCCSLMTAEEEELREILEQTDRARKMAEHELVEVAERVNLLATQVQAQTYLMTEASSA